MTPLRKRMVEDMRIRNYSSSTIEVYVRVVARFAAFHGRSPEQLGPEDVRTYQVHMLEHKTSWSVFNQSVCALRFLYRVTLQRDWPLERFPYGKRGRRLPCVLSQDEVRRLLVAVKRPAHRMALATAYGTGLRVSEVAHLRVENIDSARMLIHVCGKGDKERIVMLSPVLLGALRRYWRKHQPQRPWLFAGSKSGRPICKKTIEVACREACEAAGLNKRVTPHALRHYSGRRIMPGELRRRATEAATTEVLVAR